MKFEDMKIGMKVRLTEDDRPYTKGSVLEVTGLKPFNDPPHQMYQVKDFSGNVKNMLSSRCELLEGPTLLEDIIKVNQNF